MELLDAIDEVVVALDNKWRYTYFNRRAERVLGKSAPEVLGKTMWEAFPEQIPSGYVNPKLLEAREKGIPTIFDYYFASRDEWHQSRVYPNEKGLLILTFDITSRTKADQEHSIHDRELEDAKRELEKAAHAKDRFIAQVSHELRTPLTPVMINLTLLEELIGDDRDAKTLIEIVRRNLQHEIRLIDDLLDVTKIANGKLVLKHSQVGLHEVLANAVTLTRHAIDEKKLQVNFALLAKDDKLWADETRLQQIFWNLMHNAVKFAPAGSTIRIRTVTRNGYVVVTVQDEGVGIDREQLPNVFEPFEQTDKSVTTNYGGLGLGLAITRSLVHLHGGYITAHSDGKGKGATFRVQLPLMSFSQDHIDPSEVYQRDIIGYADKMVEPMLRKKEPEIA